MINVSAKIKGLTVVSSGSLVTFKEDIVELTINSGDDKLILEVTFEDRNDEESRFEMELSTPFKLRMKLINWLTGLGTSLTTPIKIANISNHSLHVAFAVHPIDRAMVLTYTFYSDQS